MYDEGKKTLSCESQQSEIRFLFSWTTLLGRGAYTEPSPFFVAFERHAKSSNPCQIFLKDNFCPSCIYVVIFLDMSDPKKGFSFLWLELKGSNTIKLSGMRLDL